MQHAGAQEAQLPLALRPFEVLVTSNRTALIEMVPDAPSIHTIKSKSPPGISLATHFFTKFGKVSACVSACLIACLQPHMHVCVPAFVCTPLHSVHLHACIPGFFHTVFSHARLA